MKYYICKACSNREDGDFEFTVRWSDSSSNPVEATRCPRCGSIDEIEENNW